MRVKMLLTLSRAISMKGLVVLNYAMELRIKVKILLMFCACLIHGFREKCRKKRVKKGGKIRMSRVRRDDGQTTLYKGKRKTEVLASAAENEEDENDKILFGNVLDKQASDAEIERDLRLEALSECGAPDDQPVLSRKQRKRKLKQQEKAARRASKQLCKVSDKKIKVPTPLALYSNFTPEEIYDKLQSYILTEEELQRNDFPKESSENPGYVINKCCSTPSTHPGRHCNRCGKEFQVIDGKHVSETPCEYHSKKITSMNGIGAAGKYLCCGGNFMAGPCTTRAVHVSAERFLADVPFHRVRRTGQRRSVYAVDCEMSYTTTGFEVTRVGVVGADGLAVYDEYVRPDNPVLDLNTEFSGVTEEHMEEATATLVDVQTFLMELLSEESVLVGHAVHNDLFALRLLHDKVVDTSVVYPHPAGGRCRSSLKFLAKKHLEKVIQEGVHGHDCVEDARIAMELLLLKLNSDRQ